MRKVKDIAGQRFFNLVARQHVGSDKTGNAKWLCKCDCGNKTTVIGRDLCNGHTKSCGCFRKKLAVQKGQARSKGGIYFSKNHGRWMVNCRNVTTTPYARIVIENFMGRELNEGWVVHHEDENSTNDDISNLAIFKDQAVHLSYHRRR